jgi:hypothetical protein
MLRSAGMVGRILLALAAFGLVCAPATAQDEKGAAREANREARRLAQEILDKGAALFDTKDAAAMANTYVTSADLHVITKDQGTGAYGVQAIRGRDAIREQYAKLFDGKRGETTTSKNVVEFAHKVGDDLLIIHGTFAPNTAEDGRFPFVQTRARVDGQWKILQLDLIIAQGAR